MRALVIFCDSGPRPFWLRLLKPGFRHVSAAVEIGCDVWVFVHPFSNFTVLSAASILERVDYLLPAGLPSPDPITAVQTHVRVPPLRLAPVRPYTCVEEVKRVLGLHLPWVLTPWQLYRYLMRQGASLCQS